MSDLHAMMEAQRELQIKSYGKDPAELEGEEKIQFIKDMNLALQDELHEFLDEIGWKPWATSRHVNREAAAGELIDAFHFFMNLCLVIDMDAFELYTKYMAKRAKNAKRQEEGYDGVANKCPQCKRALDDDAVTCRMEDGYSICDENGTVV
jgi:dimeric dUTPase (all-alpha-NTP-PPase superfamily)